MWGVAEAAVRGHEGGAKSLRNALFEDRQSRFAARRRQRAGPELAPSSRRPTSGFPPCEILARPRQLCKTRGKRACAAVVRRIIVPPKERCRSG